MRFIGPGVPFDPEAHDDAAFAFSGWDPTETSALLDGDDNDNDNGRHNGEDRSAADTGFGLGLSPAHRSLPTRGDSAGASGTGSASGSRPQSAQGLQRTPSDDSPPEARWLTDQKGLAGMVDEQYNDELLEELYGPGES